MGQIHDGIAVLEHAYALGGDVHAWLERITDAIHRFTPVPLGLYAHQYHCSPADRLVSDGWVERGLPDGWFSVVRRGYDELDRTTKYHRPPGIVTEVASVVTPPDIWRDQTRSLMQLDRFGIGDTLGLRMTEPDGHGIFFGIAMESEGPRPPREYRFWYRLAVHVAAGFRLRRNVDEFDAPELLQTSDAVLEADGRMCDALTDEAADRRGTLQEAVRLMDQARSTRRSDSDEALDFWRGLVDGRWSLVDVFDTDGRRYVVARRNDPDLRSPDALTRKERQVTFAAGLGHSDRRIAYALGLSSSAVAAYLASAMKKLGVDSRSELAPLLMALAPDLGAPADAAEGVGDG